MLAREVACLKGWISEAAVGQCLDHTTFQGNLQQLIILLVTNSLTSYSAYKWLTLLFTRPFSLSLVWSMTEI